MWGKLGNIVNFLSLPVCGFFRGRGRGAISSWERYESTLLGIIGCLFYRLSIFPDMFRFLPLVLECDVWIVLFVIDPHV